MCMMTPLGIAKVAGVMGAVFGTASIVNKEFENAREQENAVRKQNERLRQQAEQSLQNAHETKIQAEDDAERLRKQYKQEQGKQATLLASNNLSLSSGSPLTLLTDAAEDAQFEVQNIHDRADFKADQYTKDAQNALDNQRYNVARPFDYLSFGESLLTDGVQTASDTYEYLEKRM